MRSFRIVILILLAVFSNELQAQLDGIQLQIKVREIKVNYYETEIPDPAGAPPNPDELSFKIWVRDSPDFDSVTWVGGQCLTEDFDPPDTSLDFNYLVFNHVYPTIATSPNYFDIKLDAWEDDLTDCIANTIGSRCAYDCCDICCGTTAGGVCLGIELSDEKRCLADPFKSDIDFRLGAPCVWYDHGFISGNCPNNEYEPRVESYWAYVNGNDCANAIDLGTLLEFDMVEHLNNNACNDNSWTANAGNDVFYSFSLAEASMINISLCDSASFDTKLYLMDALCNQITFNDDACNDRSEINTNLLPGSYKVVVDAAIGGAGTFILKLTNQGYYCVDSVNLVQGTISQSNNQPLSNAKVYLIGFNSTDSSVFALDSVFTNTNGDYSFTVDSGSYYVKAAPDSVNYPTEVPTYFDSSITFQNASPINVSICDTVDVSFSTVGGANPGGPGFISGFIYQGAGKRLSGLPIPNLSLILINDDLIPVRFGSTNVSGYFEFSNLPLDTYAIWVDYPGIDNSDVEWIELTNQTNIERDSMEFNLMETSLEQIIQTTGIQHIPGKHDLLISPNPTNGLVNVEMKKGLIEELAIINLAGQVLNNHIVHKRNFTIDLHAFQNGLYFLRATDNEGNTLIQKLVINH